MADNHSSHQGVVRADGLLLQVMVDGQSSQVMADGCSS